MLTLPGLGQTNLPGNPPRVFLLDARALAANRNLLQAGDQALLPALKRLERAAAEASRAGPFSVTFKEFVPPSGDRHDYLSQAPYFWPNPKTTNGLPYVRHDGRRNPEINRISDHRSIGEMGDAVETLALAYYFTGNEADAAHATTLIRTWFLDPATRMNPNFEFAQGVPGISTGRGIGLIESRGLVRVVDAAGLLAGSKAWTREDQEGLKEWFAAFLKWMTDSRHGRQEAAARNNHGSFYDLQTASYALFLGKDGLAKEILDRAKTKRIAVQIEPDGRQPLELVRSNAWSYSVFNLSALTQLAELSEHIGVDLWSYRTPDGRSLQKAFEFLAPFALRKEKWPYTGSASTQTYFALVREAAPHYRDAKFRAIRSEVPNARPENRANLLLSTKVFP